MPKRDDGALWWRQPIRILYILESAFQSVGTYLDNNSMGSRIDGRLSQLPQDILRLEKQSGTGRVVSENCLTGR